ncbi:MAG: hypothetical protein AB7P18_01190 [Candidatus Binatia bacterium]
MVLFFSLLVMSVVQGLVMAPVVETLWVVFLAPVMVMTEGESPSPLLVVVAMEEMGENSFVRSPGVVAEQKEKEVFVVGFLSGFAPESEIGTAVVEQTAAKAEVGTYFSSGEPQLGEDSEAWLFGIYPRL